VPGDEQLQVADPVMVYGIQGIGQPIIEILFALDTREHDLEHAGLVGEATDPVELKDLKQDGGDHGNRCLPMGQDLPAGIQLQVLVDDALDTRLLEKKTSTSGRSRWAEFLPP